MDDININAIIGLLSVAVLGGIGLAAKDTISNVWASISFMLNSTMRKGKIVEINIQGVTLKGALLGFSLSRVIIEDEEGNKHLILVNDLKGTTIKVFK